MPVQQVTQTTVIMALDVHRCLRLILAKHRVLRSCPTIFCSRKTTPLLPTLCIRSAWEGSPALTLLCSTTIQPPETPPPSHTLYQYGNTTEHRRPFAWYPGIEILSFQHLCSATHIIPTRVLYVKTISV